MNTTLALLSIFLLLLSLSSNPLLLPADDLPRPVKDVSGETLQRGVDYNILPEISGIGGGVLTVSRSGEGIPCQLDVIFRRRKELFKSIPVILSPINLEEDVVRELTDLAIMFSSQITDDVNIISSESPSCAEQSTMWKLVQFDERVSRPVVTTGGVEGNRFSRFRIEVDGDGDGYKLVACSPSPDCRDIGIFVDSDGTRHLALSTVPLKVGFQKLHPINITNSN